MASSTKAGEVYYTVRAEIDQLLSAADKIKSSLGDTGKEINKAEKAASELNTTISKLAVAIKGAIAVESIRRFADLAQEQKNLQIGIRAVSASYAEYEATSKRIHDISQAAAADANVVADTYIRLRGGLKDLGYSSEETLDIIDSLNQSFVANSMSSGEASTALGVLTRTFNRGSVLSAQFGTLLKAYPGLLDNIVESTGIASEKIKRMGYDGELSANMIADALKDMLDKNREAADKTATSLGDVATRFKNTFATLVLGIEEHTGAVDTLITTLNTLALHFDSFVNDAGNMERIVQGLELAVLSVASVIAGRVFTAIAGYITQAGLATAATTTLAGAATMLKGAMAFLGGKVGLILLAASALYVFATRSGDTEKATERLNKSLDGMSERMLAVHRNQLVKDLHDAAKAAEKAEEKVQQFNNMLESSKRGGGKPKRQAYEHLDELIAKSEDAMSRFEQTRDKLAEVEKALNKTNESTEELSDTLEDLNDSNVDLTDGSEKLADEIKKLADAFELAGLKGRELVEAQARLKAKDDADATDVQRKAYVELSGALHDHTEKIKENAKKEEDLKAARSANKRVIEDLKQELEDLRITDERLLTVKQALRKLDATSATKKEKDTVRELTNAIIDQTEANRKRKELEDQRKADEQSRIAGEEAAVEQVKQLAIQIELANLEGKKLAVTQAALAAGEYATDEHIAKIKELAGALHDVNQAKADAAEKQRQDKIASDKAAKAATDAANKAAAEEKERQRKAQEMRDKAIAADPRTKAEHDYQQQLQEYETFLQNKLITEQQYNELRAAAATQYEQDRLAAQEKIFRAQSETNEFLFAAVDRLGQTSKGVVEGLMLGTMDARDAMHALAQTIFSHAIGALVDLGIQQVKTWAIGEAASAAAAGTAAATGGAMAASYAPAAAMASLASFGGNAAPASAGITSTMGLAQGLAVTGSRFYGGGVDGDGLYRVNESGKPEIFNAANGQQFLLPNTRGEVVSNKDATQSSGISISINLYESADNAGAVQQSEDQGGQVIDIFVADIMGDGKSAQALQNKFGLQTRGV